MHEPQTFEARLGMALVRYADLMPTAVDAPRLVRATRSAPPPHAKVRRNVRPVRLAVLLGLLVALALGAAALVGGQPSPEPPTIRPVPSASPNVMTIASGSVDTAIGRVAWTAIEGDGRTIPGSDVFATPGGYAAIEPDADGRGSRFWVSTDGLDWAVASLPVPAQGAVGHRQAAGEHWIWSTQDIRLWRSSDFVEWTEVDLAALAPPVIAGIDWSFSSDGPVTVGTTTVLPWTGTGTLALDGLLGIPLPPGELLTVGEKGRVPEPSLGDTRDVFRYRPTRWQGGFPSGFMTRVGSIRVELDGSIVTVYDADRDVPVAEIDATVVGVPVVALAETLNRSGYVDGLGDGVVITEGVARPVILPPDTTYLEAVGGRFIALTSAAESDGTWLVWASTDGLDWESLGPPIVPTGSSWFINELLPRPAGDPAQPLAAVVVVEGTGGQSWELWSSNDGYTWTRLGVVNTSTQPILDPVAGPSGGFLATGDDLTIHSSTTGDEWTVVEGPEGVGRLADRFGGSTKVSVARDSVFVVDRPEDEGRELWVLTIGANE